MTIKNAKGAQLQASNPQAAARLEFTPPDNGDYTVAVEHLHSWGDRMKFTALASRPLTPTSP